MRIFAFRILAAAIALAAASVRAQTVRGVELGVTTSAQLLRVRGKPIRTGVTEDGLAKMYDYGEWTFYTNQKSGRIAFVRWFPSEWTTRTEAEKTYGTAIREQQNIDLSTTAFYGDTLTVRYKQNHVVYVELAPYPNYPLLNKFSIQYLYVDLIRTRCREGRAIDTSIADSLEAGVLPRGANPQAELRLSLLMQPIRDGLTNGQTYFWCERLQKADSLAEEQSAQATRDSAEAARRRSSAKRKRSP